MAGQSVTRSTMVWQIGVCPGSNVNQGLHLYLIWFAVKKLHDFGVQ
ncbi:hypothetical protein IWX85_000571 [Polaromonas sp. CG_9.11]|nr:hypothetical protein [Polaromonas sp. CG_9.11]